MHDGSFITISTTGTPVDAPDTPEFIRTDGFYATVDGAPWQFTPWHDPSSNSAHDRALVEFVEQYSIYPVYYDSQLPATGTTVPLREGITVAQIMTDTGVIEGRIYPPPEKYQDVANYVEREGIGRPVRVVRVGSGMSTVDQWNTPPRMRAITDE